MANRLAPFISGHGVNVPVVVKLDVPVVVEINVTGVVEADDDDDTDAGGESASFSAAGVADIYGIFFSLNAGFPLICV